MLPFLENQELDELELTIFDDFISSIPLLNLDDVRQAIESDHRICSFAWHPNSSNKPILAVGNSKGTISKTFKFTTTFFIKLKYVFKIRFVGS